MLLGIMCLLYLNIDIDGLYLKYDIYYWKVLYENKIVVIVKKLSKDF